MGNTLTRVFSNRAALILVIFLINAAIGWNPKDDLPSSDVTVFFMTIPVIIYLVYWFIFQSRYNVLKSGGKINIINEYLSYVMYVLVFLVAYCFILAIPYSNDMRVKNAVNETEFRSDVENLNLGNSLVCNQYDVTALDNGLFKVRNTEFGNYWNSSFYDFEDINETISRREALNRIENFIASHSKYSKWNTISETPNEILSYIETRSTGNYDEGVYGYSEDWSLENKISRISRIYEYGWFQGDFQEWFWKISFAVLAYLALFVWVFKQMTLRYFIFCIISLALTPLVIGLIGTLLFEAMDLRGIEGEATVSYLILIAYVAVAVLALIGFSAKRLNPTYYVLTMYLNVWLPVLPLLIYFCIYASNKWYAIYNHKQDIEDTIYWSCMVVGLASIAVFKPIYAKYRSLPTAK